MTKKTIRQSPSGVPLEVLTPSAANPPDPNKYLSETGEYTVPPGGPGSPQSLSEVLEVGNRTGAHAIIVEPGSSLQTEAGYPLYVSAGATDQSPADLVLTTAGIVSGDDPGSGSSTLSTGEVLGENKVSGAIAVRSGTAQGENGSESGEIEIRSGNGALSANSGVAKMGSGDVFGGSSGDVDLQSGNVTSPGMSAGDSGDVSVKTGDIAGPGRSGNLNIQSGNTSGTGRSGQVEIRSGSAGAGADTGDISIGPTDAVGGGTKGSLHLEGGEVTIRVGQGGPQYKLPSVDGTAGQVLSTDGLGNLSWITP